jgi:hypothetical protein
MNRADTIALKDGLIMEKSRLCDQTYCGPKIPGGEFTLT